MAKGILTAITDMLTPWNGYNKQRVEEFIKSRLTALDAEKFGDIYINPQKKEDGYYHIECYASSADRGNPEKVLRDIPIPILETEEGTTYPIGLVAKSRAGIVSIDGSVMVEVMFSSSRKDPGSQAVENTVTGQLRIYGRANSSSEWLLKDIRSITSDNSAYQAIDISQCVPDDTKDYQIRMLVDVDDEVVKGTTQAVVWNSVTKTTLRLEYASDWAVPVSGSSYTPEYRIYGVVGKTLNVKITNPQGQSETFTSNVGDREYAVQNYSGFSFADTTNFKMLSRHGVSIVESWLSVTGEPEKQSEHIFNQVMVVADPSDTTPHLMVQDISTESQLLAQNYIQKRMFRYAVYNPGGGELPLEFRLTDYGGGTVYAIYPADNPVSGTQYSFNNAIEIEGISSDEIVTVFKAWSGTSQMSDAYPVLVDNTLNYSPKAGADFILNPRLRSNAESEPGRILNAKDNSDTGAAMTGFAYGDGIDGWTKDASGIKCLRVPAGHHISIPYDLYRSNRERGGAVSWSVELDFATRNVIDEDSPIFRISNNDLTKGIIMRALEGVVYTAANSSHDEQSFLWREETKTHILINVLHDYRPGPTAGGEALSISICRVFVNGIINREFSFRSDNASEWFTPNQGDTIEIGCAGADIDIYSLRIYANSSTTQLSTADCQQNFISSLPTVSEKNAARERNDIMEGGKVTLKKVLERKLNAWVFKGQICSKSGAASGGVTTPTKGDLKLWMHDDEGNLIRECSGVINDTDHENQGTTANSYAEHNQQDKFSGTSVFKEWSDSLDGNGNYIPTEDQSRWHNGYAVAPGLPYATKLVSKINWASSMQSHKMGATDLYNDLYRLMCADDKQMLCDQPNARVAVLQRPVYMFREDPVTGDTAFLGLGTFGPGKMDKPTWGYDDTAYPEFCMVEGSDNNCTLTDMRCPWDDSVTYDPTKKVEAFFKGGTKSIGFSTGKTTTIDGKKYPTEAVMAPIKSAWKFLYSCNPFIRHYDGTLAQLMSDSSVNTTFEYWLTQGEDKFHVYRYNETGTDSGEWVPAGLNGETVSIEPYAEGLYDYNEITKAVIAARVREFKLRIDQSRYLYKNDLLFNRSFLKLFAGTDNQSKNTYYCAVKKKDSSDVLVALHADDLDTIMLTDNIGELTKPYYIEERDRKPDGVSYYWEGQFNVLFMLVDLAYSAPSAKFAIGDVVVSGIDEDESLRSTMNTMLTLMGNLVSKPGLPMTAKGCIEQYFFSQAQEYFCETAYNETARLRYESNQALYDNGNADLQGSRGTQPLQQSTGDQLQAERQYMDRRMAYISSWCGYGEFGGNETTSAAWIFSVVSNALGAELPVDIKFTLTPHQWLYPSGKAGSTLVRSGQRMQPGQQYEFVLAQGLSIASDTEFSLNGINYYRSIGNIGDMPIGSPLGTLNVSGRRLVEFIANPSDTEHPQFRPQGVDFSSGFPMMKTVSLRGCSATGKTLDCTTFGRLERVDVRDTKVQGVYLPKTTTLSQVHLSAYTETVDVDGPSGLSAITVQDYSRLTSFRLIGNYGIDSYQQAQMIYDAKPSSLGQIKLDNVNWAACRKALLMWFAQRNAKITGYINMSNEDGAIFFDDKIILGKAFGDIDSDGGLRVNYVRNTMSEDGLAIMCTGFMNVVGRSYVVEPKAKNSVHNDFALREDGEIDAFVTLDDNASNYAELVNEKYVRVKALQDMGSETRFNLTVSVRKLDGTTVSASRVVAFCKRIPQLGDFAYVDGTFDTVYTEAIPLAGIVFDVRRDTSAAQETYIARVVSATTGETSRVWGMQDNYWSSSIANEITGAVGTNVFNLQELPDYNGCNPSDPRNFMNEGVTTSGAATDENGKRNTEIIITLAKKIVDRYLKQLDPTIEFPTCITTTQGSGELPVEEVNQKIAAATGNGYAHSMLFPAALYCYLWHPKSSELDPQYAKTQWYLPAMGELVRLLYYISRGQTADRYDGDNGLKTAIFARAAHRAGKSVITFATNEFFWSSTEGGNNVAWRGSLSATALNNVQNNNGWARPVAAFRFVL